MLCGKGVDQLLDSAITLLDLLAIELVGSEILLEREQVFGAIVAGQGSDNLLDGGVAAAVTMSRGPYRVALVVS